MLKRRQFEAACLQCAGLKILDAGNSPFKNSRVRVNQHGLVARLDHGRRNPRAHGSGANHRNAFNGLPCHTFEVGMAGSIAFGKEQMPERCRCIAHPKRLKSRTLAQQTFLQRCRGGPQNGLNSLDDEGSALCFFKRGCHCGIGDCHRLRRDGHIRQIAFAIKCQRKDCRLPAQVCVGDCVNQPFGEGFLGRDALAGCNPLQGV